MLVSLKNGKFLTLIELLENDIAFWKTCVIVCANKIMSIEASYTSHFWFSIYISEGAGKFLCWLDKKEAENPE